MIRPRIFPFSVVGNLTGSWCGESGPTSCCSESDLTSCCSESDLTSWFGESDLTSWCGESGPTSWCGESCPTSWCGESGLTSWCGEYASPAGVVNQVITDAKTGNSWTNHVRSMLKGQEGFHSELDHPFFCSQSRKRCDFALLSCKSESSRFNKICKASPIRVTKNSFGQKASVPKEHGLQIPNLCVRQNNIFTQKNAFALFFTRVMHDQEAPRQNRSLVGRQGPHGKHTPSEVPRSGPEASPDVGSDPWSWVRLPTVRFFDLSHRSVRIFAAQGVCIPV